MCDPCSHGVLKTGDTLCDPCVASALSDDKAGLPGVKLTLETGANGVVLVTVIVTYDVRGTRPCERYPILEKTSIVSEKTQTTNGCPGGSPSRPDDDQTAIVKTRQVASKVLRVLNLREPTPST